MVGQRSQLCNISCHSFIRGCCIEANQSMWHREEDKIRTRDKETFKNGHFFIMKKLSLHADVEELKATRKEFRK
jgi:hypothetical protein